VVLVVLNAGLYACNSFGRHAKQLSLRPQRFMILPIKQRSMWDMYKKAQSSYWSAEEVDLTTDVHDFHEKLSQPQQFFLNTF